MRRLFALCALAPVCLALAAAAPEPARPVDLQHYVGRWYEVARLPNRAEEDCAGAQVSYSPTPDGGFNVVDTCLRANGQRPKIYHPSMKILDPGSNAKFRLTFFLIRSEDYWVLDAAPNNSWVILGDPTGRYLWLFSRTPDLQAHRSALVERARSLGYDTGKLIYDKVG